LCVSSYKAPTALADYLQVLGQKRQLLNGDGDDNNNKDGDQANSEVAGKESSGDAVTGATTDIDTPNKPSNSKRLKRLPSRRLFVGKLPLVITSSKLRHTLFDALKQEQASAGLAAFPVNPNRIEAFEWIADRTSGAYYGSAWVNMARLEDAKTLEAKSKSSNSKKTKLRQAGIVMGTTHNMKNNESKPRRIRMEFAPLHGDEVWLPRGDKDVECPPFGS
jgi:hypothetical protein